MEENDVIESGTVTDEQPGESGEPSSMLEAIEQGLSGDKPEEYEKQKEAKPEEDQEQKQAPENEDEPPEGISKKAQERFRNLTSRLKEKDSEVQSLRSDLDGIRSVMMQTGGTAEDFAATFDYIKAVRSGDYQTAQRMIHDQIKQLSVAMGRPLQMEVDALAEFPDLRERVNSYQMDEQAALEMARHRIAQNEQMRQSQQQYQRQQQEQSIVQSRNQALAEVDRLGAEWAKRDPDYSVKEQIILKQIPQIAQSFPPNQWARQVELLYQTLSAMPMQQPQRNAPAPLRSSGQSAGAKQPANMLEALQNGLGYSG